MNLETMSIRLSIVEAQNQKLKRTNLVNFFLLLALLAVSGLQYSGLDFTSGKVVSAEKFVLKDSLGHIRAELTNTQNGANFALFDINGVPRAALAVAEGDPGIHLYDQIGFRQVSIGISKNDPSLTFMKPQGLQHAGLTLLQNGDLGYFQGQGSQSNQPTPLYAYSRNGSTIQANIF
ncbi:MAG: hypothetical protein RBU29_14725 [bacterium]|jgi:hypothetical protein|nr:hypothetical protein [bacterium]